MAREDQRGCTTRGVAASSLTASSTAAHLSCRDDDVRGEPACGARTFVPHPCMRWARGPDHDAVIRISSKLRGGGPILRDGIEAMFGYGTPPPRTVIGDPSQACGQGRNRQVLLIDTLPSVCGTQDDALGHNAIADEVPQARARSAYQGMDSHPASPLVAPTAGERATAAPRDGFTERLDQFDESKAGRRFPFPFPHDPIEGNGKQDPPYGATKVAQDRALFMPGFFVAPDLCGSEHTSVCWSQQPDRDGIPQ
jgi:hypothetical protein